MSKRRMKERGTARKDVWFRRRGKFAAATALLLCLCTAFSGCAGSETATSRQAELRAEAKQYDQAVNEQGIAVDLSEKSLLYEGTSGISVQSAGDDHL